MSRENVIMKIKDGYGNSVSLKDPYFFMRFVDEMRLSNYTIF